jgi:ABC-type sugar transport system substrate-binding protein
MKKLFLTVLVAVLLVAFVACSTTPAASTAPSAAASEAVASAAAPSAAASESSAAPAAKSADGMKIAFFVSDYTNTFHQAQGAEAIKYAKEKYNAEVTVMDGKSDGNVMTQNVDLLATSDYNGATLHIWEADAAKPGVLSAIDAGVAMATFFSPLSDTGIPIVRNDEAGVSFEMGKTAAEQWKKANPDKPIVMVELGWPDNNDVITGRTDPFVKGVLSVDPEATDLGCLDASKGADAAKQIMLDLTTQHPEVNIIYSEAGNLTDGVMPALIQAGRGTMDNGVPTTEIVCSVDCPESELKLIYDPNSSLKASLGLPPIETAHTRIDNVVDIYTGKIPQTSSPAAEILAAAKDVNFWTISAKDAVEWYNTQFGASIKVEDIDKSAK